MAAPEGLTLRHHRDLVGRERRPLVRWVLIALLVALLCAGLLNGFGQQPARSSVVADEAELELSAPRTLRSGLYFQARFRVTARKKLETATLVLDPDWLEGVTLNTLAPAPMDESSRDGTIAFDLGRIPAGDEHLFYLQLQVNPTTAGRRSQRVELYEGERLVAAMDRTATIWP